MFQSSVNAPALGPCAVLNFVLSSILIVLFPENMKILGQPGALATYEALHIQISMIGGREGHQ